MIITRVLALLALFLGLAHSFSWDIVVGVKNELAFYCDGTLEHTEKIPLAGEITSLTYDPVHYRVLFADFNYKNKSIFSFDLSTTKIQPIVTREADVYYMRVVYEPGTQLLFWKEGKKIYSHSLKPASSNEAGDEKLLLTLKYFCNDIAVGSSYGGYIYWITDYEIERARFDGSERELLIRRDVYNGGSFAIDPQTQKMFWTENTIKNNYYQLSIESADFNGNNRRTLYTVKNESDVNSLAVSKDFIYWNDGKQKKIWQFPKNPQNNEEAKLFLIFNRYCWDCHVIAANYPINEQTQEIRKCKAERTKVSLLCVHGTEVSGESRCECAQGYTGERCDVSLCHNFCLQGDCTVNAEGYPECSCKPGYSGERCEVDACYMYCLNNGICFSNEQDEPFCQCTAAYKGERCDVSVCNDYCLQGTCSVNTEGRPKCSCNAGYSGERCEINVCHEHCLNNGNCSLNKKGQPKCRCNSGYSGERCEVNPCAEYCLNNGSCSLNDEQQPVCRCTAGYEGARCDVSVCKDLNFQAACSVSSEGQPKVTVTLGRAVESTCAATTQQSSNN